MKLTAALQQPSRTASHGSQHNVIDLATVCVGDCLRCGEIGSYDGEPLVRPNRAIERKRGALCLLQQNGQLPDPGWQQYHRLPSATESRKELLAEPVAHPPCGLLWQRHRGSGVGKFKQRCQHGQRGHPIGNHMVQPNQQADPVPDYPGQ
jgi:hypothetical protein